MIIVVVLIKVISTLGHLESVSLIGFSVFKSQYFIFHAPRDTVISSILVSVVMWLGSSEKRRNL